MFESVSNNVSFPKLETDILEFWQQNKIYEKSLERRADAKPFVFFEGPPTANGMPHPGHCLTRAIKDLFPRYRTMRGYRCERKAGWDTHGLPVEVEVCKELGIHSKEEIEEYGVEPFIQKCQQSVWRYMQEWERMTNRLGFWVDLEKAYVTYHQSYVESVWWCLKNLFDRGLLYQGHKIVWWWAQGGTALSSGEVGQGYREVADPSVYVRFPLLDSDGNATDTSLLVWTTTPWTLPSNQFAAVKPELDYATVVDAETNDRLIIASALVETIAQKTKRELNVESTCKGSELLGKRYRPPFDYYYKEHGQASGTLKSGEKQHLAWRVVGADFVSTDSGSGVVHQAPAFGEVDYDVLIAEQNRFNKDEGPELICAVGPDGKFTEVAGDYQGRWVKEADKDINRELKTLGLMYHVEQYLHEYPFCWRAEQDPLIQYPRRSWFVRTTRFKNRMLANNAKINWLPEHIRDGRFGNFLESNVDWALSRERYWGTPLPIWVCEKTGEKEAISCYSDLLEKPGIAGTEAWEQAKIANGNLPEDLKVHKPYIDQVTYDSPFAEGARMKRVTEVIDCWFDSGAMPFAQWGYPHQGSAEFSGQFPADFISEALDQTRGWFYSLLAISTLLFSSEDEATGVAGDTIDDNKIDDNKIDGNKIDGDKLDGNSGDGNSATLGSTNFAQNELEPKPIPHPFRNCIVLGLMLGEDGQKMSKSKRNYREPGEIFDKYGADALRWYLFANQAPWTSIRYNERSIKDSIPEFLLRFWNVYSFFLIYANIDGFAPSEFVDGEVIQAIGDEFRGAKGYRPASERSELDRWILSELNQTLASVIERMDAYDNYAACGHINSFVDALSNWFVRRSRPRYWSKDKNSPDKLDAYWTLYECLLTTSKIIAPFVPFLAESVWQNLTNVFGGTAPESVHLCDYPEPDKQTIDHELSDQMTVAREIVSLGRSARMDAKLKVRQPLTKVEVVLGSDAHLSWLKAHEGLIREELNVKAVEFTQHAEEYITYQVRPNFKLLGPLLGKDLPEVKKILGATNGADLLAQLNANNKIELTLGDGRKVELTSEHIEARIEAKDGWAAAQGNNCVVVLSTELTPELVREGHARDLVRYIQERRKELDCQYTDRIAVTIDSKSDELLKSLDENRDYIMAETLAIKLQQGGSKKPNEFTIGDEAFGMDVEVTAGG